MCLLFLCVVSCVWLGSIYLWKPSDQKDVEAGEDIKSQEDNKLQEEMFRLLLAERSSSREDLFLSGPKDLSEEAEYKKREKTWSATHNKSLILIIY